MKLLVGADPELFVRDGKGQLISGHHFQCGTKEKPMAVANGHVQNDGMALEFNVKPSETRIEFVSNTLAVLKDLNSFVQQIDQDAKLVPLPVADFGEKYIDSVPVDVSALGCNPDYNAYTESPNPTPNGSLPFRTGSGHIHIGWTTNEEPTNGEHFARCCALAKEMDYYLGLPSLLWDSENRRRQLYGKAGAFRPKPYGMEYRVLSNAWLRRTDLMDFVFTRTQWAAVSALSSSLKPLYERYPSVAHRYINDEIPDAERKGWPVAYQGIASRVLKDRSL